MSCTFDQYVEGVCDTTGCTAENGETCVLPPSAPLPERQPPFKRFVNGVSCAELPAAPTETPCSELQPTAGPVSLPTLTPESEPPLQGVSTPTPTVTAAPSTPTVTTAPSTTQAPLTQATQPFTLAPAFETPTPSRTPPTPPTPPTLAPNKQEMFKIVAGLVFVVGSVLLIGGFFSSKRSLIVTGAILATIGIVLATKTKENFDPSEEQDARQQPEYTETVFVQPADWEPTKFGRGPPLACDLSNIQNQPCVDAPGYQAPDWAPHIPGFDPSTHYCQPSTDCSVKGKASCTGCCTLTNDVCATGISPNCQQISPRFNWIISSCDTNGAQQNSPACLANPFSTNDVYYIAAYQLDKDAQGYLWRRVDESCINPDGETLYANWQALPSEPHSGVVNSCSGAGGWNTGYFPSNVAGLAPPGFMFVMSYEKFYSAAWFVLNQSILNRGPQLPLCNGENCWLDSAGELDLLESPNLFPPEYRETPADYLTQWTTQYNAQGKCFPCNRNPSGSYDEDTGGCGGVQGGATTARFINDGQPHVFVGVVDARGTTIYRDPEWTGISPHSAAPELRQLAPNIPPLDVSGGPCEPGKSCMIATPSCVHNITDEMTDITCGDTCRIPVCYKGGYVDGNSCTGTWWDLFMDTGQWICPYTSNGK